MKRTIALLLSLTLILCMTAGLAEQTAEKTRLGTLEVGKAFMIQSMIPENYTFSLITSSELNLVGVLSGGEGRPTVYISIAYSEEYADMERFNDVDEATVQEIRDRFLDMDITFDYCIGVSAGSANAASFVAGQRDWNQKTLFIITNKVDNNYVLFVCELT